VVNASDEVMTSEMLTELLSANSPLHADFTTSLGDVNYGCFYFCEFAAQLQFIQADTPQQQNSQYFFSYCVLHSETF